MPTRNWIALALTVVSVALLLPGLQQPMMTITASMEIMGVSRELFRQTQSVIEAVRSLHESGNDFVAGLILFFSVTVPFLKIAAVAVILGIRRPQARYRLYLLVRSISKWAMADVFVVGVFIAMLAAKATDNLDASAESGFYYFAAYCLVSNLAFQFLTIPSPGEPAPKVSRKG
ncbi:MAG: paraquat-inducible protein A [Gemmatimonadota bacterium]|nr:paraquat-inducible protein A [Gemmatimonadota bacterium]